MAFSFLLILTLPFSLVASEQEQLELLLQHPDVKKAYEACQKDPNQKDLAGCTWGSLSPEQQKQIQEALAQGKDESKRQYEGVDIAAIKKDQKQGEEGSGSGGQSGLKKLEEYYFNRLRQALYGQVTAAQKEQGIQVVDHRRFYDLYETQVSKNIVMAVSSYCFEAIEVGPGEFIIPSDYDKDTPPAGADPKITVTRDFWRQKARSANIKLLADFSASQASKKSSAPKEEDQVSANAPEGASRWNSCVVSIQDICHEDKKKQLKATSVCKAKETKVQDDGSGSCSQDDFKYSQMRACEVVQYLKTARQNLIALSKLNQAIDSDQVLTTSGTEIPANVRHYDPNKEGQSVDDLTTLTSAQVGEESGMLSEAQKEAKEYQEKCLEGGDQKICEQYIQSGKSAKAQDEKIQEYSLRSKAMEEKLSKLDEDDKLVQFLKEEGRSEDEIAKLMQDPEGLKQAIKERYEKERLAIVESLKNRSRKSQGDRLDIKGQDQPLVQQIAQELSTNPERMVELTHFNNIVSGYLEYSNSEGKGGRNTAGLYKELGDSAFDPQKGAPKNPYLDQTYFEELKKNTQANVDQSSSTAASKSTIQVDTVNHSLLDYEQEPPKQATP